MENSFLSSPHQEERGRRMTKRSETELRLGEIGKMTILRNNLNVHAAGSMNPRADFGEIQSDNRDEHGCLA